MSLKPLWPGFRYFSHQEIGIRRMLELERDGVYGNGRRIYGGFQCDEMGLGKTIQIVGTMRENILDETLILCPLAMVEMWSSICDRVGFQVLEMDKHSWRPIRHGREGRASVYVTNYDKLIHREYLLTSFDRVILDEAHTIRNPDSVKAKAVRNIECSVRWCVTGTPLVNSYRDVVSLLAFLGFKTTPSFAWIDAYDHIVSQIMIHRCMESIRGVLPDAPPVPRIYSLSLPFHNDEEKEFYCAIQGLVLSEAKGYSRDAIPPQRMLLLMLRLRQISVHPQVYIQAKRREDSTYKRKDWKEPSTKMIMIEKIIRADKGKLVQGQPHRYLIFCQFHDEMDLLHEFLASLGVFKEEHIFSYHGGMSTAERDSVLKRSKACEETAVMLLQLQAGGVGLNLQEYDRVIFMGPWWTSALMDQAIARAVRMGQTRMVRVYHLHLDMEDSGEAAILIDRYIYNKAEVKRGMLEDLFHLCPDNVPTEHVVENKIVEPGSVEVDEKEN